MILALKLDGRFRKILCVCFSLEQLSIDELLEVDDS